jgi:hypothetical protein
MKLFSNPLVKPSAGVGLSVYLPTVAFDQVSYDTDRLKMKIKPSLMFNFISLLFLRPVRLLTNEAANLTPDRQIQT